MSARVLLKLNLSHVLTVIFLFTAALVLAYVGGMMVGRGSVQTEAPGMAPEPQVPPESAEPPAGILAAEDLRFAHALRNLPLPPREAPPPPSGPAGSPAPSETPEAASTPAQSAGGASNESQAVPAGGGVENKAEAGGDPAPATTAEASSPPEPLGSPGPMSDYVFQVAALRDEKSADVLRQKLEGLALRTRLERSGRLFLVLVLLRGNEERVAELKASLKALRLGEPVLRARTPAQP